MSAALPSWLVWLVPVVALLALVAGLALLRRRPQEALWSARFDELREALARLERGQRDEQRQARQELADQLARTESLLRQQLDGQAVTQAARLDAFDQRLAQFTQRTDTGLDALRQHLGEETRKARAESAQSLAQFGQVLQQRFDRLGETTERRLGEIRDTLAARLKDMQGENAARLEQMRQTVDEKLQSTLEQRLGESFRLVSERLEQVHRGLGEMQSLATGVGDLKRVLSNVKTRGIWGEVQLSAVLEQILTPEQFGSNVAVKPGSAERVEYAVRLPGTAGDDTPVWLPIDAKFPREDYERLLDAQERADAEAAAAAAQALERRVRDEARAIAGKYIAPPHTTDFALLFLPTEGLYAEVLRRPGLMDALQREQRVVVVGPTTLAATLNSLRMGFRTLAIEQRSSEVWQVLGAVKTEFGKFGDVLAKTHKKLNEAANVIEQAGVRTRAIERKLRSVEAVDEDSSRRLLGDAAGPLDDAVDDAGP